MFGTARNSADSTLTNAEKWKKVKLSALVSVKSASVSAVAGDSEARSDGVPIEE